MRQPVDIGNDVDDEGNPAGGYVAGTGIGITWQAGPLGRGPDRQEPNGAFVEDVIESCAERIRFYQSGKFACRENALALTKLEEAPHWLDSRTKARVIRGVEGTHTV